VDGFERARVVAEPGAPTVRALAARAPCYPAIVTAARRCHVRMAIAAAILLCAGHSVARAQERRYLVAGHRNSLPNPAAIVMAGGTWTGQIASIGLATVTSSQPDFLDRVKNDRSVELAGLDLEARLPEAEPSMPTDALEEAIQLAAPVPNEPFYFLQWPHRVMDIQSAREWGFTGNGVTVAVLDNGIDCSHPDLRPPIVSRSFVPFGPLSCSQDASCAGLTDSAGAQVAHCDLSQHLCVLPGGGTTGFENPCIAKDSQAVFHGTSVTGIIAAICGNQIGACGVAPDADVVNVKVVANSGDTLLSTILLGLDWIASEGAQLHGVRIINASISVGCPEIDAACRANLIHSLGIANRMLERVYKQGVVVFASAGNQGTDVSLGTLKHWPALDSPHTVAVGATGVCNFADFLNGLIPSVSFDHWMPYSNYGFSPDANFMVMPAGPLEPEQGCSYPIQKCTIHLSASRSLTLDCYLFDATLTTTQHDKAQAGIKGYTLFAGTSAATANASGLAALALSAAELTPGQLIDVMLHDLTVDLGDPGFDPFFGYGRGSATALCGSTGSGTW
jgi:subtilisin family serine protease